MNGRRQGRQASGDVLVNVAGHPARRGACSPSGLPMPSTRSDATRRDQRTHRRAGGRLVPVIMSRRGAQACQPRWFRYPEQPDSAISRTGSICRFRSTSATSCADADDPDAAAAKPGARASAALLDSVYLQHFGPEELARRPGPRRQAVERRRRLRRRDRLVRPDPADPFVAKCAAPRRAPTSGRVPADAVLDSGLAVVGCGFAARRRSQHRGGSSTNRSAVSAHAHSAQAVTLR